MYRTINFGERTTDLCTKIIDIERERYRPYYEAIVDYAKKSDVIVDGRVASDTYTTGKCDTDKIVKAAKPIVMYSDKPYDTAVDITNMLYRLENPTVAATNNRLFVWPVFAGEEYEIMLVGARKLAIIKSLGTYRDVKLSKLIHAKKIGGIKLMSPENLLIEIYRRFFYAVADGDTQEIEDIVNEEATLFRHFVSNVNKGKFDVAGGTEPAPTQLRQEVIERFAKFDTVVVGKQATSLTKTMDNLQLVTDAADRDIFECLKVDTGSSDESKKSRIEVARYGLSLPVDQRLRRFRMFIAEEKHKIRVVDVFNAGQYDLYANHPFLLLRFIFVDLWTISLIFAIGDINADSAQREINRLIDDAIAIHKQPIETKNLDMRGTYVDEMIARRRAKKFARRDNSELYYAALGNVKAK